MEISQGVLILVGIIAVAVIAALIVFKGGHLKLDAKERTLDVEGSAPQSPAKAAAAGADTGSPASPDKPQAAPQGISNVSVLNNSKNKGNDIKINIGNNNS